MKTIFAVLVGVSLTFAASAEDPVVSGGISQIVKMSQSGVAPSVVEEYINSSQFPFKVTVDDVLYMHKEGVPMEIVTTLMRHGEEIRRANATIQAAEARRRELLASAPAQVEERVILSVPTPPAPAYYQPPVVYTPPPSPTYVAPYPAYPYYPYPGYYDRGYGYGPAIGLGFGFSFGRGFSRGGGFGHGGGHWGHR